MRGEVWRGDSPFHWMSEGTSRGKMFTFGALKSTFHCILSRERCLAIRETPLFTHACFILNNVCFSSIKELRNKYDRFFSSLKIVLFCFVFFMVCLSSLHLI